MELIDPFINVADNITKFNMKKENAGGINFVKTTKDGYLVPLSQTD